MKSIFRITCSLIFVFCCTKTFSQNPIFLNHGTITYSKTVNTLALLQEEFANDDGGWAQQMIDTYKKTNQKFQTTEFSLIFKNDKTLYSPIINENAPQDNFMLFTNVAATNTVYTDLDKHQSVSAKNVYDNFLVTDSTRKIRWKITNELRNIAGFQCRRANAVIMDSIYVVAFYTDQIPVSGGPESFTGLPGMIMQVTLPHQHVTWVATQVNITKPIADNDLTPPTKGKPMTGKEYFSKLQSNMKDWGKTGAITLISAML